MMIHLKIAFRYILGRKLRSILTITAILIGVMLIFGLNGILPASMKAFKKGLITSGEKADLIITSRSRGEFDISVKEKLFTFEGIDIINAYLNKSIILPDEFAFNSLKGIIKNVTIIGIEPNMYNKAKPLEIIKGKNIEDDSSGEILIGEKLAKASKIDIGDIIKLPSANGINTYKVTGIFEEKVFQ